MCFFSHSFDLNLLRTKCSGRWFSKQINGYLYKQRVKRVLFFRFCFSLFTNQQNWMFRDFYSLFLFSSFWRSKHLQKNFVWRMEIDRRVYTIRLSICTSMALCLHSRYISKRQRELMPKIPNKTKQQRTWHKKKNDFHHLSFQIPNFFPYILFFRMAFLQEVKYKIEKFDGKMLKIKWNSTSQLEATSNHDIHNRQKTNLRRKNSFAAQSHCTKCANVPRSFKQRARCWRYFNVGFKPDIIPN